MRSSSWGLSGVSGLHKENSVSGAQVGHVWLWGLTGEQEWTPDLTTGKYRPTSKHKQIKLSCSTDSNDDLLYAL